MMKPGFLCVLFSIFHLADFSAASQVEGKRPLGNLELHQLRQGFASGDGKAKKIKGSEVKVRVLLSCLEIHGGYSDKLPVQDIPPQKVMCKVLEPEKGDWAGCELRLISLRTGFFRNLKEGEEYQLEGTIMEDGYHDGHFTVYAHGLSDLKQEAASQAASDSRSEAVGIREFLSRISADAAAAMTNQDPLGNEELVQLRAEFDRQEKEGPDVPVKLRGTEVKVRVVIDSLQFVRGYTAGHRPPCKPVSCIVSLPGTDSRQRCSAHLINLGKDFYAGIKEGEDYMLEGIIADDHYGFGNFWIYANSLNEIAEQGVAPQSATRSESDSEGGDKPRPESEAHSR